MSKKSVSQEYYQRTQDEGSAALEILEDDRFSFLRDYLNNSKTSIEKSILNNTIREAQEVISISNQLTHIFKKSKQLQVDEEVGKYKFITQLFDDLRTFVLLKEDLDTKIANKEVALE